MGTASFLSPWCRRDAPDDGDEQVLADDDLFTFAGRVRRGARQAGRAAPYPCDLLAARVAGRDPALPGAVDPARAQAFWLEMAMLLLALLHC